jgi:DNA-binding ferritin-like protein
VVGNSRRDVLRFLAGVGVGAGIVEVYERLYNMPLLEERFRAEVSYWINEYNTARERLSQLEQEYNSAKETITNLTNEYNMARERINQLEEQHNSTLETISSMDRLEEESSQAILHYRERMDEAIKALKNTVEKYRVILGDERVSFESTTLKVLEDLKLSQDKLLKLLPYFPLIRDLSWRPSRVVNDKIYDIRVELEVISPLNTLAEVEVSLIPVEYEYFITRYGMRREDYPKAFPPEETKTIKLRPAGLERETFNVEFKDIIGGREYQIYAAVKDSSGGFRKEAIKTPYVRQFENIAVNDGMIVIADYYAWYEIPEMPGNHWRGVNDEKIHLQNPLLGEYSSGDPIVISKHIDWATGYGIDAFSISWWTTGNDERTWDYHSMKNIEALIENPLINDIRFCILYENNGRLRISNPHDLPTKWVEDLDDQFNRRRIKEDLEFLARKFFQHPSYLKIRNRPVVDFDYTIPFRGDVEGVFAEARGILHKLGVDIYLINDLMGRSTGPYDENEYNVNETHFRKITEAFDCISASNFPGAYDDVDKDIQFVERVYKAWREYADLHGKDFIPAAWPGHQSLARTPERLRRQIEIAKKFTKLNVVSIISFNEWISSHHIEPSSEEKFKYLESS